MDVVLSLIYLFIFSFGLCIGSFLNCVIYRLEEKKSLQGRSYCPQCNHPLSWRDLFPVFSFLRLRGKCQYCHEKISIQYPLVELATGILFVLLFNPGSIVQSVVYLLVSCFLIVIFVYDLKHSIIPDIVLFPAIAIALIYQCIPPYHVSQIISHIIAAVGACLFFLVVFLGSKRKGMGFGDVKLAFFMGLLLGVGNVLVSLFLAFFFGAIIGIVLLAAKKKSLKSEIPFGPFLILGTFIAQLYGNNIIQWYLSLLHI